MAQFDPTQRRETWLFQELGPDANNRHLPVFRALKYVLVSYDGDPLQYLEPVSPDEVFRMNSADATTAGTYLKPVDPRADGLGRCVGVKFFTSRPFEAFALDDYDALNVGF